MAVMSESAVLPAPIDTASLAAMFGMTPSLFIATLLFVSMIALALKGVALWHASRNAQLTWFIFLVVVNTFGILEIVYLLFFRPKEEEETSTEDT